MDWFVEYGCPICFLTQEWVILTPMFNTGVEMTRQEKRGPVDAWMKSGVYRDEYASQNVLNVSAFRRWIANYAYLGRKASSVTGKSLVTVQINAATILRFSEWAQIMMMLAMIGATCFYGWRMKER